MKVRPFIEEHYNKYTTNDNKSQKAGELAIQGSYSEK